MSSKDYHEGIADGLRLATLVVAAVTGVRLIIEARAERKRKQSLRSRAQA